MKKVPLTIERHFNFFWRVLKYSLKEVKPPADVTDSVRSSLLERKAEFGRNFASAKLI